MEPREFSTKGAGEDSKITVVQEVIISDYKELGVAERGKITFEFEAKCPKCDKVPTKYTPALNYPHELLLTGKTTVRCGLCEFSREVWITSPYQ